MNNTKTIDLCGKLTDDYFRVIYTRGKKLYIKDIINKINFDNYHIYKTTNNQKLSSYEDFINLKYASFTFFKKELYNINNIDIWVDYFNNFGGIQYLIKPTPPFNPFNKLIIKK